MRIPLLCTLLLLVATGGANATVPAAEAEVAAPPDIPADHGGCNYFYWHGGDVANGDLPGYRYRPCLPPPPTGQAAAQTAVVAALAPPDIPPQHGGCDYFYWDSGDVKNGELPGYRYRPCLAGASVPAAQAAALAPPDIPPQHSGCGYFYWDSGDVKNGELPGYRYRHCI